MKKLLLLLVLGGLAFLAAKKLSPRSAN